MCLMAYSLLISLLLMQAGIIDINTTIDVSINFF